MNKLNYSNERIIKLFLILIFLIVPWSLSDYTDTVTPQKITSDLRFYQINTCNISLFEFLSHNFNVVYQDHYKLRFNDYSSIKCFGQITGIDQIGYTFYISIGTNALINLFLQSTLWILLISLIKREKKYNLDFIHFLSIGLASLLFCLGIFSEERFYSLKIYLLDLTTYKSYIYLFIYFFYVSFFSKIIIETRKNTIIYLLPFLYLFIGLHSGWNIYFMTIFFVIYGIEKLLRSEINRKYFSYLNLVTIFWGYQAISENYYLDPDKIRGLSNTGYNFPSLVYWSYYIVLLLIGTFYFFKERSKEFELKHIIDKFIYSGTTIFILGYLGSSMPFFNFFNYYLFGQTKYGTNNQEIFGINYWGERVAWRGYFSSAETIGEFFGLGLLIFILLRIDNLYKFNKSILLIPFFFLGLFASNNKAATIALLLCIFLKINKNYRLNRVRKILIFSVISLILIIFIRPENLFYSIDFISKNMTNLGNAYSLEESTSSSLKFLNGLSSSSLWNWIILLIGQISFLINRSELWGIFLARYNPNYFEFLFGTGFFTLTNLYSELEILPYRISSGTQLGFLLPHSSVLLFLLFFGLIGLIIFAYFIFKRMKYIKLINYNNFLIALFILINIFKSDSILYLPSLITYFVFIFVFLDRKNISKI